MRSKFLTSLAPMALPWYRLALEGPAAREKSMVSSPEPPSSVTGTSDGAPVP